MITMKQLILKIYLNIIFVIYNNMENVFLGNNKEGIINYK